MPAVPRVITEAEWHAEGERRFGPRQRYWAFQCPLCRGVQTGEDFSALGCSPSAASDAVDTACIGGYVEGRGCEATVHGLHPVHRLVVVFPDGHHEPRFEFAPAARRTP
ncbi:VVA0879 family protein [Deinococcus rufus]|uniref:VVA0879 family protein n=1 Tax=Deinococcus rufus TaxID=2136097 RepID=A0ABV7ZBG8_9DEIO